MVAKDTRDQSRTATTAAAATATRGACHPQPREPGPLLGIAPWSGEMPGSQVGKTGTREEGAMQDPSRWSGMYVYSYICGCMNVCVCVWLDTCSLCWHMHVYIYIYILIYIYIYMYNRFPLLLKARPLM